MDKLFIAAVIGAPVAVYAVRTSLLNDGPFSCIGARDAEASYCAEERLRTTRATFVTAMIGAAVLAFAYEAEKPRSR